MSAHAKQNSEEIDGEGGWEVDYSISGVAIGLEIHLQLNQLKTKLFCGCNSDYRGDAPNSHCCPICMGLPGTMPMVNEKAIELASKLALAVGSTVSPRQFFYRKNYYYPDMSRNFQITQYNRGGGVPFASGGKILIKLKDGKLMNISLDRMHLEDDPGKLVHKGSFSTSPFTSVDYNRCGTALIEIVTKPELHSPEDARAFLNKLKSIISHIEISDVTMDGAFRVDANISLEQTNRSEIKNIASVKEVEKALRWEIFRHKQELKRGKEVKQETRAWNGRRTILLRSKEQEDDYRYFPEPDLVPFMVPAATIQKVRETMPELPDARINRMTAQYNLTEYDVDVLVSDKAAADFYEKCAATTNSHKLLLNWINNDIQGYLNEHNQSIKETKLTPSILVEMMNLIQEGKISTKIAKTIIPELVRGKSAKQLVSSLGLAKIDNLEILEPLCEKIIENNPKILKSIEKKPKAFMALVGLVMKETKGKADTRLVQEIFAKKIGFDLSRL